jgi:hypothetical protein
VSLITLFIIISVLPTTTSMRVPDFVRDVGYFRIVFGEAPGSMSAGILAILTGVFPWYSSFPPSKCRAVTSVRS